MAKPRGDLGALVVPKATAAQAVPHAQATPSPAIAPASVAVPAGQDGGAPKALTVKLDAATYRRLRRYCREEEDATGKAPTHQQVMVAALLAFLPPE
ncbi:hypothetical protein [Roseomonas sp. BN140053]|uniref:hypothetical protein n=1 Tax=Roseomonas sp. BN140053 TaxID=3391898 RepID=UPI0039E8B2C9